MKQEVIEKFNAVTDETVEDYCRAREGGFQWTWFLDRARRKAIDSGFLPRNGFLLFEPRYIDSAERVLDGLIASMKSVEGPNVRATKVEPWERTELEQWKQLALSFSALSFDAGCVAALTLGHEEGFDPLEGNAPAAIFGDVGFLGLGKKAVDFVTAVGGESAAALLPEVADCCVSHLYADEHITGCAFKEAGKLREAFFRGVCKAAYVAGATFVKMASAQG